LKLDAFIFLGGLLLGVALTALFYLLTASSSEQVVNNLP
jgi:hypothetical protein